MTRSQQLVAGLGLAIASAACWAGGNVLTRWTATRLPLSTLDVVLLKALVAAGFLALVAVCFPKQRTVSRRSRAGFVLAALFKGLNTYFWILAVVFIPAGTVTALENLQVVWVALFLTVLIRQPLPPVWLIGAGSAGCGAACIGQVLTVPASDVGGLILGLLSGVMFAGFIVTWKTPERRDVGFRERSLEMAALLLVAAALVCPAHWLGCVVRGDPLTWPFMQVGWYDGTLQAFNGLVGTGVTYLLLNEATALLGKAGRASDLLLALGLSLAVPLTLVMEWVFLGLPVQAEQWVGVGLFVMGFVLVRTRSSPNVVPVSQT